MTTQQKWEVGGLVAIAIVLLLLLHRKGVLSVPVPLNLPAVTLQNADPTVAAMPPGPLADPPFADPGALPFTGQYACGCGA